MRLVCPDVQKGGKRIIMNTVKAQGYLDGLVVGDLFSRLASRTVCS
jgi:hypothetical protein